jgi:hypothetical protein
LDGFSIWQTKNNLEEISQDAQNNKSRTVEEKVSLKDSDWISKTGILIFKNRIRNEHPIGIVF